MGGHFSDCRRLLREKFMVDAEDALQEQGARVKRCSQEGCGKLAESVSSMEREKCQAWRARRKRKYLSQNGCGKQVVHTRRWLYQAWGDSSQACEETER